VAAANRKAPQAPSLTQVELQAPPQIQRSEGLTGALAMILPMFGSMGMMAVMALSGRRSPMMILMSGLFMVAMLGVAVLNIHRNRTQFRASVTGARREYLTYIARMRKQARETEEGQREFARWFLPHPADLPLILDLGLRTGERTSSQGEFLLTRVGLADQPLSQEMYLPEDATLSEVDPVAESAVEQLITTYAEVKDLPLGVNVGGVPRVCFSGPIAEARSLARSMLIEVCAFTSATEVRVAILASERLLPEWEWAKWLPHVASDRIYDAVGPARMIDSDPNRLTDLLPEGIIDRPRFTPTGSSMELPHLIIIKDGVDVPPDHPIISDDGVLGVTIFDIGATLEAQQSDSSAFGTVSNDYTILLSHDDERRVRFQAGENAFAGLRGLADQISVVDAEAVARRLASRAAVQTDAAGTGKAVEAPGEASAEITDLLGIPDIHELDVTETWKPRLSRDRLRVPIGLTPEHKTVFLDIKESAQQGMGPHGLIIGATGSGKSEVLRTLVLALAMTHSSEELNFVLIDFKGGATFAGMSDMPHVAAIITNLGEDLTLVDRMEDALRGEMARRQEMLRAGGNFKNVADYEKARKAGRTDLEPLPALLIVADEFSELLAEKPDFIEMFVAIGRLGRSLQIHLLLSSQRLEEGRLRGLDSHLSYRIGLRTFSAQESRSVIGVTDAYELPPIPGVGYLKPDTTQLVRFRASYVSGPPPRRSLTAGAEYAEEASRDIEILDFTAAPLRQEEAEEVITEAASAEQKEQSELDDSGIPGVPNTTFDIAVSRMAGRGPAAHQVWLPPLDIPSTLDSLMPDLTTTPELGLHSPRWRTAGAFTIPVGDVDRPLEQRRDTMVLDLDGAGGHLAILGGPQSGKSTFARTVLGALALTHSPREVQMYVMDFGGGTFSGLRDLPHVAGLGLRADSARVHRIYAEVASIVDDREKYFAANGIESMAAYRRLRAEGKADDGYGDVFLFVDGWATLRADYEDVETALGNLIPRGLNFGLHVVATALRWMNFRTQTKDLFGSIVELALGDPSESEISRKGAEGVPSGAPGRGLEQSKHQILGGLPRIDGNTDAESLSEGVAHFVRSVKDAWTGGSTPKLRELPELVNIEELNKQVAPDDHRIILGVDESRLEPFGIDFNKQDHFFFFGDRQSGKTSTLRLIAWEVARLYSPKQAQLFVVDYRRSLLGELPDGYLGGYYTNAEQTAEKLTQLYNFLKSRIPGSDITPQQLRERSWWTGAEAFVLVDDYDIVQTTQGCPVHVLQELLPQAHDLGLHVIVARRSGGAQRAMFDPIIQSINDLANPGMLLPGNPEEGNLLGRLRPQAGNAGRGQFRSRDVPREVLQVAWRDRQLD